MKLRNLVALFGVVAVLFTGCDPVDPDACTTNFASFNVYNNSTEIVDLTIDGPTYNATSLVDLESRSFTVLAGNYYVTAVGRTSGAVIASSNMTFRCGGTYQLDLNSVIVDLPYDPELDIYNDTNENLIIYIDDFQENTLLPGQVGTYVLSQGYHWITVVQESTGQILYDDYDAQTFYANDNIYELRITSTHPEIEVHNNLDLTYGASAEAVVTWLNYDLGGVNQTPIVYDWGNAAGFSNVLPAEIGGFSVYRGEHLVEVAGETTGFFYVDVNNGFMLFPENTTTVFDIR